MTLQTRVPKNFRWCRWRAERRVERAQTRERGPPSAPGEIFIDLLLKAFYYPILYNHTIPSCIFAPVFLQDTETVNHSTQAAPGYRYGWVSEDVREENIIGEIKTISCSRSTGTFCHSVRKSIFYNGNRLTFFMEISISCDTNLASFYKFVAV